MSYNQRAYEGFPKIAGLGEIAPASARSVQATSSFPSSELYGLSSQTRRSAISIPQTSQKARDVAAMPICAGCCKLPLVLPANSNTNSFWHLS
ncbi:MAG: four helix bundle protein [Anaerolineales bacterium]|nr:four helix bundle protein [Anaerolineales bacterium]MCW5854655.1 four helix bundle protein [Anaerolineales bacterium]